MQWRCSDEGVRRKEERGDGGSGARRGEARRRRAGGQCQQPIQAEVERRQVASAVDWGSGRTQVATEGGRKGAPALSLPLSLSPPRSRPPLLPASDSFVRPCVNLQQQRQHETTHQHNTTTPHKQQPRAATRDLEGKGRGDRARWPLRPHWLSNADCSSLLIASARAHELTLAL